MAFSIALIIIFGLGADYLFRLLKLPGLIGMLIAGLLILAARLVNVSMATVRSLLSMMGQKRLATAISSFESLIFILVVGRVLQDAGNIWTVLGYSGGSPQAPWSDSLSRKGWPWATLCCRPYHRITARRSPRPCAEQGMGSRRWPAKG